jgi:3-hydroxyacyl-[acyl-carrier protein] dehydratase/trans-2-decenoyl-[acyl-carrier protein] isomerase
VTPDAKLVTYRIDVKRVLRRGFAISIANGTLEVDGQAVYEAQDLKVGVFTAADQM